MAKQDKMIEFKKKESMRKEKDVKDAVKRLEKNHSQITIASICREARVSKSFIYKNSELYELIASKRSHVSNPTRRNSAGGKKSLADRLYETIHSLNAENETLKNENKELQKENLQLKKNSYKAKFDNLLNAYKNLQLEYNALYNVYEKLLNQENFASLPKIGGMRN